MLHDRMTFTAPQPAAAAMIYYAQIWAQFKVIMTIPNREEKKHCTPTDSPESKKS